MKRITVFALLAAFLLSACGPDIQITRKLNDDWWPIHASGDVKGDFFSAQWDADLDGYGKVDVTYYDNTTPSIFYVESKYYPALSFEDDGKNFRYIDISTKEPVAGRYLRYYVKNKKIYFELANETGRGSGEYDDGHDISFESKDILKIGNVTFERFSVYYEKHLKSNTTSISETGRIPITCYQ